jgi:hypothetical protein
LRRAKDLPATRSGDERKVKTEMVKVEEMPREDRTSSKYRNLCRSNSLFQNSFSSRFGGETDHPSKLSTRKQARELNDAADYITRATKAGS